MFPELITSLLNIAQSGGKEILTSYKKDITVKIKKDKTPLTIADKNSNTVIIKSLSELTPNIPIISEENDIENYNIRKNWHSYWLVDPLDGTRDFINQTGDFTINIALIENNRPIFGLLYAPAKNVYYYAYSGGGAFKKKNNLINKININKNPNNIIKVLVGNYSLKSKKLQNFLNNSLDKFEVFEIGSALKFAYLAEGKYDLYPRFGTCCEWDTAAGVCILEQAGGKVLDTNGNKLFYNMQDSIISPNFFAIANKNINLTF